MFETLNLPYYKKTQKRVLNGRASPRTIARTIIRSSNRLWSTATLPKLHSTYYEGLKTALGDEKRWQNPYHIPTDNRCKRGVCLRLNPIFKTFRFAPKKARELRKICSSAKPTPNLAFLRLFAD
ncbi:MAG: hypothetical protein MZU97_17585 [Bacillus subtilis]|nr:hypothetical protein [Bacillus subtilis]